MDNRQNETSDQTKNNVNSVISENQSEAKQSAKWIDNSDNEVEQVFGFNKNAELVNARAAMIGFIMMILTELIFRGEPVTNAIFGIN